MIRSPFPRETIEPSATRPDLRPGYRKTLSQQEIDWQITGYIHLNTLLADASGQISWTRRSAPPRRSSAASDGVGADLCPPGMSYLPSSGSPRRTIWMS